MGHDDSEAYTVFVNDENRSSITNIKPKYPEQILDSLIV